QCLQPNALMAFVPGPSPFSFAYDRSVFSICPLYPAAEVIVMYSLPLFMLMQPAPGQPLPPIAILDPDVKTIVIGAPDLPLPSTSMGSVIVPHSITSSPGAIFPAPDPQWPS